LHHKQKVLLRNLREGELPHNLTWRDLVDLIDELGTVEPHGGDEAAFVVGSQRLLLRRPRTHSFEADEVARVRKFLREAEAEVPVATPPPPPGRIVVVIDHHAARLYQDVGESRPEGEAAVRPWDPHGFLRHLIHRREAHYAGQRVPEEPSFYEQIAKDLVPAQEIILIGHGTGKSSALDYLVNYLKSHHPEVATRVVGTEVADLSGLNEPEIEAIASHHW
jgi:hypothetical protein